VRVIVWENTEASKHANFQKPQKKPPPRKKGTMNEGRERKENGVTAGALGGVQGGRDLKLSYWMWKPLFQGLGE